ncbi:short transient receptor potential channel 7-like isoform X3 [Haliotis asinina]|uniref:short transient receptor potential channel 7-like isoform X3 n=2 Tax=Haliotis asinina TaxID=109174 RepID=UPI003531A4BA
MSVRFVNLAAIKIAANRHRKVDMPLSGRGKWRRRGGSYRHSFISNASQESAKTFADAEEEFIHAAEFGDIPNVKKLLTEYPELNPDCIDALGRTALRLAVKNEHLEVVEVLLDRSNQQHIYEAVLQAISAGHVQIAETILKHKRYVDMWRERRKLGDQDGFYKTANAESQFSPDITPLMLASQKNQYEIVQLLLLRDERIQKPHKYSCGCNECDNKIRFDQLRLAKYRLNAYRGLSSEAYISLSSKDPILTAFELAAELRKLSKIEKHFKLEYRQLADQLSEYVVKLLDRIRTQEELDLILNKTGDHTTEAYENMARFQLALDYKEKRFVAHPNCQQRLVHMWYRGMRSWDRSGTVRRLALVCMFILAYPFLVLMSLVHPTGKFSKILRYPFVKFLTQSFSHLVFLVIIVVSTAESSYTISNKKTLKSLYPDDFVRYHEFRNLTKNDLFDVDFPLRSYAPTVTQVLLTLWILGFTCAECSQIYVTGLIGHVKNLFNLLDFMVLSTYSGAFTLTYFTMIKFHFAVDFIATANLTADIEKTHSSLYWLNADRMYWNVYDPINLAEGMFAVGNILSFSRISYLLPANETLGPLQISLGRMIKDILKFLALFSVVILAFMVGLHNLYWYYSSRHDIEVVQRNFTVNAEKSFGDVMATFRTVFWSLFGRGEPGAVQLGDYNHTLTQDIGYFIYGSYNIAMVTVLLNMLIAMMTRSFTNIAEDSDVQWKFARSLLYMDYILDAFTLPVPLNLLQVPKSIFTSIFCPCDCSSKEGTVKRSRFQNDAAAVSGTSNPVCEATAVEMHESNARNGVEGTVSSVADDRMLQDNKEDLTYQAVIQRIIQRYIFDIQREAEVTEDDFEEIKQDISSFRYEMLNQWRTRETVQNDMANHISAINKHLDLLKHGKRARDSITENTED